MNVQDLEQYKQNLLLQRQQLVGQVNENQRQTFEFGIEEMQDPVDVAVIDREQTIMLSITESERDLLEQIDEALQRIELQNYGTCQNCGQLIAEARLNAVPYARYCMTCQEKLENGTLDDE